jgi:CheY-like chemotaxis protein
VLVVEDNFLFAVAMADALRQLGCCTIGPCATVDAALRVIRDDNLLNAAIIDIDLRGEMAFPVADALLAAHVPFVWATCQSRDVIPERHGNRPLITKPFLPHLLIETLATTIHGLHQGA